MKRLAQGAATQAAGGGYQLPQVSSGIALAPAAGRGREPAHQLLQPRVPLRARCEQAALERGLEVGELLDREGLRALLRLRWAQPSNFDSLVAKRLSLRSLGALLSKTGYFRPPRSFCSRKLPPA